MKKILSILVILAGISRAEQPLPFTAVPDMFQLPDGVNFGGVSSVAVNSAGHIYVLNRGPHPLVEFTAEGKFVRFLADGLLQRPHGLRIDRDNNLWIADVAGSAVYKMNPQGHILMVLGTPGQPGEFNDRFQQILFTEPDDIAFGPNGEFYISEGHGGNVSRIRKFDHDGNYLSTFGKKGDQPGEFSSPHAILIGRDGLLYVVDRENKRIQILDANGKFLKSWSGFGWPNTIFEAEGGVFYITDANSGRIMKLDHEGKILGSVGKLGKGLGQFTEAHTLTMDRAGNIYVADTFNWRVQKFVPAK